MERGRREEGRIQGRRWREVGIRARGRDVDGHSTCATHTMAVQYVCVTLANES